MTTLFGADASYAILSPTSAKALWDDGHRVFQQCLWTGVERPVHAIDNLRIAEAQGFILAGYGSLAGYSTGSSAGATHALATRKDVPDDLWAKLVLVPCDVELPGIDNLAIRTFVETLAGAGKRRSIYTSLGHWKSQQGDTTAFTDCLLQNAYWDDDPDTDFPAHPFGGWSPEMVVGEQYAAGANINGLYCDKDTWNQELLMGTGTGSKYTDEVLDAAFTAILSKLGEVSGVANAAAGAIINHIYTHPGGGASQTMAAEIAELEATVEKNKADFEDFKAKIAAVAGNGG